MARKLSEEEGENLTMVQITEMRWPFVLVILSILFGTGLGMFFGIGEDKIKAHLEEGLAKNSTLTNLLFEKQSAEREKLKTKSWSYIQRAHLHGGGISALSLGLLFILSALPLSALIKNLLGLLLALGTIAYPIFWLMSGLYAPQFGTSLAKEKFELLASGGRPHVFITVIILILLLAKPPKNSKMENSKLKDGTC